MARTKVNPQAIPGAYNAANGTEITLAACDEDNGNYAHLSGGEMLMVKGTGLITILSVPDGIGRTGDLSKTLAGTEDAVFFGPFPVAGFAQSDGALWFNGVDTLEVAWLSPAR